MSELHPTAMKAMQIMMSGVVILPGLIRRFLMLVASWF